MTIFEPHGPACKKFGQTFVTSLSLAGHLTSPLAPNKYKHGWQWTSQETYLSQIQLSGRGGEIRIKRPGVHPPEQGATQLDSLLDLSTEQLMDLVHARARRRFQRGLKRKPMALIKKLRKAKKEAPSGEKPGIVKTHLRFVTIRNNSELYVQTSWTW